MADPRIAATFFLRLKWLRIHLQTGRYVTVAFAAFGVRVSYPLESRMTFLALSPDRIVSFSVLSSLGFRNAVRNCSIQAPLPPTTKSTFREDVQVSNTPESELSLPKPSIPLPSHSPFPLLSILSSNCPNFCSSATFFLTNPVR